MNENFSAGRPAEALSPRYGMVVDINRCVGCQTCTISCKHVNDTPPEVQWRRVLDVERGTFPDVERLFLVVGCQHCADPPCVPVCPTGATAQRADGLVTMDYDRCLGCGYCAVACPYQARTITHSRQWYYGEPTKQEEAVAHDERIAVASKCTFCIDKIDTAAETGGNPGVDLDLTPACAASCITQAIKFGDFNDASSEVSRLTADNAHFQMHAELGTDPQIKYLYEVPHATPGQAASEEDLSDDRLSDPENPLVGKPQTFWDWRAAMNFTLGGMSTGLAVLAYGLSLLGVVAESALPVIYACAAVGMAIGLFFVFLEIGRQERFLYVLLRPQSSWMTRETYAVALFYPAVVCMFVLPHPIWAPIVALAAAAFLLCQARILFAGKGIPAWRAPLTPWLIAATAIFEGAGWLGLGFAWLPVRMSAEGTAGSLGLVGVLSASLVLVVWMAYLGQARAAGIGPLARAELARIDPGLRWLGYAGGAGAFALAAVLPIATLASTVAFVAAAVLAIGSGIVLKFALITRACHQQGYAIPWMPQRGSGARAAPLRLDPGQVQVN